MMRLWVQSYAKSTPVIPGAALSAVTHAVLIAGWVYTTLPAANVPEDSIANRVYYIPPPDKTPGERTVREVVRYVEVTRPGLGFDTGDGPRMMGNARPVTPDETIGQTKPDTVVQAPTAPVPPPGTNDSVFTVLDVDTAVVRSNNSAAPAYPLKLLQAHVMGSVSARYVVDTTGFADTASFEVIKSTHPEFVAAVRDALPYMRFTPAKIGSLKVRQLVEQQFSFRINDTTDTGKPRKPPN
jgi:hypothetical protein